MRRGTWTRCSAVRVIVPPPRPCLRQWPPPTLPSADRLAPGRWSGSTGQRGGAAQAHRPEVGRPGPDRTLCLVQRFGDPEEPVTEVVPQRLQQFGRDPGISQGAVMVQPGEVEVVAAVDQPGLAG